MKNIAIFLCLMSVIISTAQDNFSNHCAEYMTGVFLVTSGFDNSETILLRRENYQLEINLAKIEDYILSKVKWSGEGNCKYELYDIKTSLNSDFFSDDLIMYGEILMSEDSSRNKLITKTNLWNIEASFFIEKLNTDKYDNLEERLGNLIDSSYNK